MSKDSFNTLSSRNPELVSDVMELVVEQGTKYDRKREEDLERALEEKKKRREEELFESKVPFPFLPAASLLGVGFAS